ncbi:MAG: hypothetical protein IPJ65_25300 [Archangiaceae bacterium]|nr:hypothetical protein [Archangiaceae bacterium]
MHDPYAGAEVRLGSKVRLTAEAGWRWVMLPGFGPTVRGDGSLLTCLGAFELPWASSIEVHATHLERSKVLPFSNEQWRQGTLAISFRKRPWFAVSGILDYTTEAGQPQVWYPGHRRVRTSPSRRTFASSPARLAAACASRGCASSFRPFMA